MKILELLSSKSLESDVKTLSNDGKTILHYACLSGQVHLCKYLIKNHPRLLDVRDIDGLHAIHAAAYSGNIELFKFLVEENEVYISKQQREKPFCINLQLEAVWSSRSICWKRDQVFLQR